MSKSTHPWFLCLLLLPFWAAGQVLAPPVKKLPLTDAPVARLAQELTAALPTEKAKVEAIFSWITGNIDYKVRSVLGSSPTYNRRQVAPDLDTGILKPLDERVAERVLETREAVCDGYARLFKTLCTYAGIRAEVVSGYARGDAGRLGRNFRSNHSWNAVTIDSAWYLLDATWASGYVSYRGDQFIRSYDARYFLTSPQQFIQDHYPEDPSWALLPQVPPLAEFHWSPFRHSGFVRNRIQTFAPSKGTVEAAVGDTVWIELETEDQEKHLEVWDHPFGDPRLHTSPIWHNYPERAPVVKGRRVRYAYTVSSPFVEYLYVVYNGEPVLQYRLKIRKPEAIPAQTAMQ